MKKKLYHWKHRILFRSDNLTDAQKAAGMLIVFTVAYGWLFLSVR